MALTPFQEGVIAAKSGISESHNPHPPGTDHHQLWREGYEAAQAVQVVEERGSGVQQKIPGESSSHGPKG